jgi:hypothetical protein
MGFPNQLAGPEGWHRPMKVGDETSYPPHDVLCLENTGLQSRTPKDGGAIGRVALGHQINSGPTVGNDDPSG